MSPCPQARLDFRADLKFLSSQLFYVPKEFQVLFFSRKRLISNLDWDIDPPRKKTWQLVKSDYNWTSKRSVLTSCCGNSRLIFYLCSFFLSNGGVTWALGRAGYIDRSVCNRAVGTSPQIITRWIKPISIRWANIFLRIGLFPFDLKLFRRNCVVVVSAIAIATPLSNSHVQ